MRYEGAIKWETNNYAYLLVNVLYDVVPVKLQRYRRGLNLNPAVSRLHEILRYDTVRLVNRGPESKLYDSWYFD